jgi:citrate synthase
LILINIVRYHQHVTRLSTAQAANRLGVKPATIYAYVSRGVLTSEQSSDGRSSTFAAADIEQLARRGRPREASRSRALDFTIDTAITSITQTHLKYRGRDAVALSKSATFEQVAELLLTGKFAEHEPWPRRQLSVPATHSAFDHVSYAALAAGAADPFRSDLSPTSVAQTARTLIASVVDSMPVAGDGRTARLTIGNVAHRGTIAGRLWAAMSPKRPTPGMVSIINAALVLLADHELAVSTVAVRVAASTRADPYAVIGAGVAAISGPLHGGASRAARRMVDSALTDMTGAGRNTLAIERAAAKALEHDGIYPGFGHKVYKHGDPRANALLSMLRDIAGGTQEMTAVDGLIAAVKKRRDIEVNIDLALAALGAVAGLGETSGERIFLVGRIAGWTAHTIEEYAEAPLRFRARAVYVG